jgi:ankyrin repeat protein
LNDAKVDVNLSGDISALSIAARCGGVDVVEYLLPVDGIDVNKANKVGETPLFLASFYGRTDVVSRLLADWRADPNTPADCEQLMPLHAAALDRNVDVVKQLASRDDVLQWYQRWATNRAFNGECERAQSKLNILLDFHNRLNRARFQRGGGESLLLRCNAAMLSHRLDQSLVRWPTRSKCRRCTSTTLTTLYSRRAERAH